MPVIIFLIILALVVPARAEDIPYGVVPLWKIDIEKMQVYRNVCWNQKTGERECCIGFDIECAPSREMWFHFPQGINNCEEIYHYENDINQYSLAYCTSLPDPVTKEVQIEECPLHWPGNPEIKLMYAFPLNPIPSLYEEDRNFYYRGTSPIISEYKLGKYRVTSYSPFMLGWGNQDEFFRSNRFSRKDVKDMVCEYGPFNQSK